MEEEGRTIAKAQLARLEIEVAEDTVSMAVG